MQSPSVALFVRKRILRIDNDALAEDCLVYILRSVLSRSRSMAGAHELSNASLF